MMRRAGWLLLAVVLLGGILATGGHRGAVALALYLAAVTGAVALACARLVARSLPASALLRRRAPVPGPHQRAKLAQLAWLEGRVSRAYGSAEGIADFRPILAQVAAAELERTRGVSLQRTPERARELLGERLWAQLNESEPRGAPLELRELRLLLDELEAIG